MSEAAPEASVTLAPQADQATKKLTEENLVKKADKEQKVDKQKAEKKPHKVCSFTPVGFISVSL
jgi:hypothetical protein